MKLLYIFILFLISSFLFCGTDALKCGENEISNCIECGIGENASTCISCEDKHFLFFHNLLCLPCDDPLYGQVACGGNCDSTNYETTRNVLCEKNGCKEGFYNLNGICFNCSVSSTGCKKCVYNEEGFKCLECSDKYKLDSDGLCRSCWYYSHNYCNKCAFNFSLDNAPNYCEECNLGYYLDIDDNRYCKKCKEQIEIDNGYCRICSDFEDDYEPGPCWCNKYYTQKSHSNCVQCPDNCPYCEYNHQTNKAECLDCDSGYTLNSEKTCTYCGEGCEQCTLSEDNSPICSLCFSHNFTSDNKCLICVDNCKFCENKDKCIECNPGYTLLSDGTCRKCPNACTLCKADNNDKIICSKCEDHYGLKDDKECIYCRNITDEGMEGCERCGYNKDLQKFECYECLKKERDYSYDTYNIYTYVNNTYQCFNNSDKNQPSFYGCQIAQKIGDKYECLICDSSTQYFIMVKNEKKCTNPHDYQLNTYCQEAENIGDNENPIYSCTNCDSWRVTINEGNRYNCLSRYDYHFQYCSEGIKEHTNNDVDYRCTQCVPNAHLNNESECECDSDSFNNNNIYWCYKCDDTSYGNPGCLAEKGCKYFYENDQLNCNECKEGYFNFTEGQCFSCSEEISNCGKCHFDELASILICDKCQDDYEYNDLNGKCELKYDEDPEISKNCLIIQDKKCKICKYSNYLLTKEGTCVYCDSDEYGGHGCNKCSYDSNDNVICEDCQQENHILSPDGKCFNCHKNISNCEVCGFITNNDNTQKAICKLCKPGYYLNNE